MLKLVGSDGERFYSWELAPGQYTLGRHNQADFCVPDKTVSRKHASLKIPAEGDAFALTDLGSHNGTTHNGQRVEGTVEVKAGDRLTFGHVDFKVVAPGTDNGPKSSPTISHRPAADLEKSVVLSIDEALSRLPTKMAGLPDIMNAVSEMARMIVHSEPKNVMLQRSLELVAKVVPGERLAALIKSADGEDVEIAAAILPQGKDLGDFNLSTTLVNDILTNKNAILIEDTQRDQRYAQQHSVILSGMKSAMAVPLFDEGEVHGILYVDTTNPVHRYNDDYLRLVATFGNIIASRLQNYALLDEREERRIMEAEMDRAASIQSFLLPHSSPDVPGYQISAFHEASRQVAGDLYDLRLLPDGRLVFMVADVSGKGMGAALLMSDILAAFRVQYHDDNFDLRRAVELVSRELCAHSAPGDFATLFVGVLDPVSHQIRYVNAGHPYPMLVHADGKMEELESSGTMIGAFEHLTWDVCEATFAPDDVLFVFTDGVTEAEKGEEQYADLRMVPKVIELRTLPAEEITQRLVDDVMEFADDASGSDDITMLVLKREI